MLFDFFYFFCVFSIGYTENCSSIEHLEVNDVCGIIQDFTFRCGQLIGSRAKRCGDNIGTKPCGLKFTLLLSVYLDFHILFKNHVTNLKLSRMNLLVEIMLKVILIDSEVIIGLLPLFI